MTSDRPGAGSVPRCFEEALEPGSGPTASSAVAEALMLNDRVSVEILHDDLDHVRLNVHDFEITARRFTFSNF